MRAAWVLILVACSSKKDAPPSAAPPEQAKAVDTAKPAPKESGPPPALASSAAPGKAYFVVKPRGVIELDGGKLKQAFTLPDDQDKYVSQIARAPNGDLLV